MKAPAHRKIIFISHDSSLTGAPILLLNLLGLLKESGQQNIRIILYRGGVLENDFKKLGRVTILKSKNYSSERSLIKRGFNFLKYRWQLILIKDEIKNAAIIFNNTIANGKLLKDLNTSDVGVITYVHELESVISSYKRDAAFTFKHSDVLVCPSHAVADNLAKNHAISTQKLVHLKYYFPFENGGELISKEQARQQFPSSAISFSSNKFYVVAMGTATHRKGIDVFLEAAKLVKDINPDIILFTGVDLCAF